MQNLVSNDDGFTARVSQRWVSDAAQAGPHRRAIAGR